MKAWENLALRERGEKHTRWRVYGSSSRNWGGAGTNVAYLRTRKAPVWLERSALGEQRGRWGPDGGQRPLQGARILSYK